jgi:hypothetical protein
LGEYNKAAERFNEEIEILRKLESQEKNSSSKFQPV